MHFTQDSEYKFYYLGEEEPYKGIFQELVVNRNPRLIAIDTETVSLEDTTLLCIAIAFSRTQALCFQINPEKSPLLPMHLLQDPAVAKIFHNALFDLYVLRGLQVDYSNIRDTHVMALLSCSTENTLEDLAPLVNMEVHSAKDMLGKVVKTKLKWITVTLEDGSKIKIQDDVECKGKKTMLDIPAHAVAKKCMQDAMATYALYEYYLPKIDLNYFSIEMQAWTILERMSQQGMKIDQAARAEIQDQIQKDVDFYESTATAQGFRVSSSKEVGQWLAQHGMYSEFKKAPINKKSQQYKTDEKTLRKINHPIIDIILGYREKDKLMSTYILPYAGEERAYTRYHGDARTGRPSSTDRNMQNIPPFMRKILLPDNGEWTDSDWSQTELRCLAYLSQDRQMNWIYSLPEGDPRADIHQATADFMHIPRKLAKNVNFAMIYGGTAQTIMETANLNGDIELAARLKESWFDAYPEAGDWIRQKQYEATHRSPVAITVFGRRLPIVSDYESDYGSIERKAVDYPCQGTAAEILKRGLIICKDFDLTLQVHDEILIDGHVQIPTEAMSHIAPFYTPLKVKYMNRWE
jgi:DNA polymerase-1